MSIRPRAETAVRRLRWKSDFEKKCLVRGRRAACALPPPARALPLASPAGRCARLPHGAGAAGRSARHAGPHLSAACACPLTPAGAGGQLRPAGVAQDHGGRG